MITKVTFDRHTHLASSVKTLAELHLLVKKVFKHLPKRFDISFEDSLQNLHSVASDHDLRQFYETQHQSEGLLTINITPAEIGDESLDSSEDEEFYVLEDVVSDHKGFEEYKA